MSILCRLGVHKWRLYMQYGDKWHTHVYECKRGRNTPHYNLTHEWIPRYNLGVSETERI